MKLNQDLLAAERTILSYERTVLSYLRLGIGCLVGGITYMAIFNTDLYTKVIGVTLISAGVMTLGYSLIRVRKLENLKNEYKELGDL